MTAAQVARGPIQLAEAVEDGALDAMLGVTGKGNLFIGIELAGRIKKPEHAGMDQIVKINMDGKILVHPDGDRFHQRKMLEDDAIASSDLSGGGDLSGLGFHLR